MELLENNIGNSIIASNKKEDHEDDVPLPGFRFHPTDEELVGFYLKRKVEKRPISIELIKHADIYKYDPWDLPKSSNVGEKEWYFFCKRGRKYRNSIRPNRVTGSGFWKATGIDRPIYSSGNGEGRDCIGLKKSLVYYRGSAGKGTKTDWMMHEFRLPSCHDHNNSTTKHMDNKTIAEEAEVWTLCRILKRDVSYRKCIPDWQVAAKKSISNPEIDANSKSCSMDSTDRNSQSNYISFNTPMMKQKSYYAQAETIANQHFLGHFSSLGASDNQTPSVASSFSSPVCTDINELLRNADWEDLQSISEYTASTNNPFYM